MIIGGFDTRQDVLIVAEAGNNHEGNFDVAMELVRKAAESGVDAVKFQTFKTEYFISASDQARFERLKSFELTYGQFEQLSKLARSLELLFISTPLDLPSAEFLSTIVDSFKIASGDNNFYPLIDKVASFGKPLIISSGLTTFDEIQRTVDFVRSRNSVYAADERLGVLHCVTSYPVPAEGASLLSVRFLAERLDCTVGYSDHTEGIEAPVIATALGARIVEKHFTLSKTYSSFRDHQLSADPSEMRELVKRIRNTARMLGSSEKTVQSCEREGLPLIRRSIAAAKPLPAGHRITASDLMWLRPGNGIAPGKEDLLVNKTLKRAIGFGEQIHVTDIDGD